MTSRKMRDERGMSSYPVALDLTQAATRRLARPQEQNAHTRRRTFACDLRRSITEVFGPVAATGGSRAH